jgi:hypothetical protein
MPTKEEWESHREAIYRIYMVEGKPLKELILEMKEKYGFSATYVPNRLPPFFFLYAQNLTSGSKNQYFYKFKQWHMPKYLSPEKWKAIGKLERQRQESGCSAATVVLGGHRLHREKVQRQIARYSFVSTCDFMYPGM